VLGLFGFLVRKTPALMLVDGMSIWELTAAVKSSSGCYARNLYRRQRDLAESVLFI
jgi:hypothetical protein